MLRVSSKPKAYPPVIEWIGIFESSVKCDGCQKKFTSRLLLVSTRVLKEGSPKRVISKYCSNCCPDRYRKIYFFKSIEVTKNDQRYMD